MLNGIFFLHTVNSHLNLAFVVMLLAFTPHIIDWHCTRHFIPLPRIFENVYLIFHFFFSLAFVRFRFTPFNSVNGGNFHTKANATDGNTDRCQ